VAEIRHLLSRYGGSMSEAGSVSWQFTRAAYFSFPAEGHDPDAIFELAVDGGADDVKNDGETVEIIAPVEAFKAISDRLHTKSIQPEDAGLRMLPNQEIELEVDATLSVMKLVESLEELDDVQIVFTNLRITDEAVTALEAD